MLGVYIIRLPIPSFIIPKGTVVDLTLKTKFKVALNMGDLQCHFEDISYPQETAQFTKTPTELLFLACWVVVICEAAHGKGEDMQKLISSPW